MAEVELIIRGGVAVTMDAQRRVGALDVRVVGRRIAQVGEHLSTRGAARIIDARGCAVLPGLIHSHVHLCQVLFRNFAEDRALLDWLKERIWPLEAAHDETTLRTSTRLGLAELIRSGSTAALDMGTVRHHDQVFEVAREVGFRLQSGKAMMDGGDGVPEPLRETAAEALSESDRLERSWQGAAEGLLSYAYAPRFVPSCSPELLGGVAERVAAGKRLHTHASESGEEIALIRRATGLSNVAYLARLGLLSPRTTLAHGVHLEADEVGLLAQSGTSVAHCPSANLKLASGVADTVALVARGVNVGLGADGAPCNNNLDLWREMKLAALLPKLEHGPAALAAAKVLEMATLGGARALGLEHEIGSLEPGKQADLAVVDLQMPHVQPLGPASEDVVTALVYASQASDVRHVFVAGRQLLRDGELVMLDESALVADAQRDARAVRERAGLG